MHNFELANAVSLEGDDDTKATIMHEDARRHEGKAKELEGQIAKYRDQLAHQEQEAAQVRQELDREIAQHDAKVADLRKRLDNLEGASLF
jgi:uncharacterized protein YceH (UPF0502 family)